MLDPLPTIASAHGFFPSTCWSVVRRAGSAEEAEAGAALAQLCREYWYPLYSYTRRRGHSPHDAQDLTQSFIVELIDGPLLARADPGRGRFRSFVLGALQNFLSNEHRRQRAERRGGKVQFIAIDAACVEGRLALETADGSTPEEAFERNWALTLLDAVLQRLRVEYDAAGRAPLFAAIEPYLAGKEGKAGYAAVGRELGLSENTVAMSVHRLRRRYGELLRAEIAMTVASPEELEEEIAYLVAVLSR